MRKNASNAESGESREAKMGIRVARPSDCPSERASDGAFSLIEVMVVVGLLALIVLALMAVFNSTQTAFRASVTQTDVLEGGRATMDLMTADLRQMAASDLASNLVNYPSSPLAVSPVNFYAYTNFDYAQPLVQGLPGSTLPRTNVLENFFLLSRGNLNGAPTWIGIGYAVFPAATNDLYPLYRFYQTTNVVSVSNQPPGNPAGLFHAFMAGVQSTNGYTYTNWSHLLNGVVDLRVRIYNPNGYWMTNSQALPSTNFLINPNFVLFLPPVWGEGGFYLFSNALPASVEVQMGVLEDRVVRHAWSLLNTPPAYAQFNYLSNQAGGLHLFRERVTIPNVDDSAYQ